MYEIVQRLEKLGITVPEILFPCKENLNRWSVIACDQFTQDRSYWEKAEKAAAGSPSILRLILPEAFLADAGRREHIDDIHRTMRTYLDAGVFAAPRRGFVYLERDTPFNRGRRGLVAAVDLEQYDWPPAARPLIRATEGTVPERLPPRMDIRRNAPLETSHIILLIDDETDTLLPGLAERVKKNPPAYRGGLMLNSGSVSGWFLNMEENSPSNEGSPSEGIAFLAAGLEELARKSLTRYAAESDVAGKNASGDEPKVREPFLFAVGDGNHSLAAAKGVWEECKAASVANGNGVPDHRCRYALVEIENIYDPAIQFEPIHRIVFGIGFDETLRLLSALPDFFCRNLSGREEMTRLVAAPVKGNCFGIISGGRYALVETSAGGIATACLQPLLDSQPGPKGVRFEKRGSPLDKAASGSDSAPSIDCMRSAKGAETNTLPKQQSARQGVIVDYIHGEDELFRLAGNAGGQQTFGSATGILLPPVQKSGLFETVARRGALPRKSFSMGNAEEKRFYLECRKLFD